MLQHSRIRATYNIDGTTADDCCSAYALPNCTLMQDDREIRAREFEKGKHEKGCGEINNQPSTQPEMQYASPALFRDEPIQHRGSLLKKNSTTAVTGQTPHGLEKSQHYHQHKKLNKNRTAGIKEHASKDKGKKTSDNQELDASDNGNARTKLTAYLNHGDRASILASRQKWRNQTISGNQEGGMERTLANCLVDDTRESENHGLVINRRTLLEYSDDASMSQVRGKRVLKQLSNAERHTAWSKTGDTSEGSADEPILVFYDDGDLPQRHSLADFARLRASTLGRTDTSPHDDIPAGWRKEKTVGGNGQSKPSGLHNLAVCPEVVVTEDLKPFSPHNIFNEYIAEDTNKTKDVKQHHYESHSLRNCSSDTRSIKNEAANAEAGNSYSPEQHLLNECATDAIADVSNPETADEISQHSLSECVEKDVEYSVVGSATLDQHEIADCAIVGDAQVTEHPSLDQHALADCATIVNSVQSEASDKAYSVHDDPRSELVVEQRDCHSLTIHVPQPHVITVTTAEVLEEATGEQHDQSGNKIPETIVLSKISTTSTENKARPASPTSDHDGTAAIKDGQQQLGEAADALRKVLGAAANVRHVTAAMEFEINDPTEVNSNGTPKKSSHGSRTRAIGARAQKSKGEVGSQL